MSDREEMQAARRPLLAHFNVCCRWSAWCLLDTVLQCRSKRVCDRHDTAITGGSDGE